MTTEHECIEALREAAEGLGESPTREQYDSLGMTPAASTILRVMGGWNDAKEAAGLETFPQGKDGGRDVQPKPDHVDLPDDKEWTDLSGYQRWYYKNPQREIEKKDRRRATARRWLYEFKRDECECERCGAGSPGALDFHHPGEKDLGVSEMVAYGYSVSSIRAEIEACVTLCANCHRKEHYEPPPVPEGFTSQDDRARTS